MKASKVKLAQRGILRSKLMNIHLEREPLDQIWGNKIHKQASSSPSLSFSRCEGRYATSPFFAITPSKGPAVRHHSTAAGLPSPLHLPTVIFYPRFQPTPSFPPVAFRDCLPRRADTSIQATTEFLYFRSKPQPSSLGLEDKRSFIVNIQPRHLQDLAAQSEQRSSFGELFTSCSALASHRHLRPSSNSEQQASSSMKEITKEFEERKIELKAKALEIYQASDVDIKVCC
ncbi:uncharacterized protein LOC122040392 [Zingiber officinale]|uniref:uncharacterized protein LOC122040392 n=1 Tax=Zingiber officinale TaxID=94328 RepID=UPI001C4C2DB2|nr:uncharacterized protein LOC122040392 [Zingiber officinale]